MAVTPNQILISLAAFGAAIGVFTISYIVYIHVKMYRRGAAFKKLNPTMPIHYSAAGGFILLRQFWGDELRKLGVRFANGWESVEKFEPYAQTEDAIFAIVTPFSTEIKVANAEVIREIALARTSEFPKPVEQYKSVSIFGPNLVSSEGEMWKRHRRVAAPHFSEKNNAYVHEVTARTLESAFAKWKEQNLANGTDETAIDVHNLMFRVALSVISDAAFGVHFEFDGEGTVPPGYTFSFQKSLEILAVHIIEYIAFPKWVLKLPYQYFRDIDVGFSDFYRHMKDLVAKARSEDTDRANILTALVKAVDSEKDESKALSEEEMISSMFILMFAGHETTANVLSYATAIMAMEPHWQDKLYEETNKVVPLDETPSYKHYPQLRYTMAIMNETMRMHTTVSLVPKSAGVGPSGNDQFQPILGGKYQVPVNFNTTDPLLDRTFIHFCFIPLHRNPKYWGPDPDVFRPERWLENSGEDNDMEGGSGVNKYAFAPFSVGARACIGKKFSQVEFVCAMTLLNRYYTWRVSPEMADPDVLKTGSLEQIEASANAACRKAVEKATHGITLKPGPVKLLFKRRVTA